MGNIDGSQKRRAAGAPVTATFGTLTAEAGEARTQSIQLKDAAGNDLANRAVVDVLISTDANGDTPGDGALTITLTAGTDGALYGTAGSVSTFISEADGDLDVTLTDGAAGAASVYLHVVSDGVIIGSSGAIAFA